MRGRAAAVAWALALSVPLLEAQTAPQPDLSALEPAVAEQIRELRRMVEELQAEGAGGAAWAAAAGELAMTYHAYGLLEAARSWYAAAAEAAVDIRWRYYLAMVDQLAGRLDEAEGALAALAVEAPERSEVWARLGEVQLERGASAPARASLDQALARQPGDAGLYALLGQVALSERRWGDAVAHFERALAAAPRADRLHHPLGLAYRGLGATDLARRHLEQRGETGVRFHDPLQDALEELKVGERLFLLRGRQAFAAGSYAEAAEAFRQAAEHAPESVRARVNLGTALGTMGDAAGAREAFEHALALDPSNATAHYNLGRILASGGFSTEALPHLRAAVAGAPEDEDARLAEVEALLQSGDPTAAVVRLDEAHRALPSSGRIAVALAKFLAAGPEVSERDGERALELAQRVYEARQAPEYAEVIALALAELGRCEEAASWERAVAAAARAAGDEALAARAETALAGYSRSPCRPPIEP